MKGMISIMAVLAVALCAPTALVQHESTEHGAAHSDDRTTLFENAAVRVSRIQLAPGEASDTHQGESRIVYSLSDYLLEWRPEGGDVTVRRWRRGDVHFHPAGAHAVRNVGAAPAEFLVFERLSGALADEEPGDAQDVAAVSPAHAALLYENAGFRVMEVSLEPGGAIPEHGGRSRVIYSLSEYEIAWSEGGAEEETKSWAAGDVHFHERGAHAMRNIGETPAELVIVALKE